MIPRDYQRAAVDAAREKTGQHGNTMLVLPTGAGKTAIAGFYIGEEVDDTRDARVLVLQHTDELIEQNRGAIAKVTGLGTSVVKAEQDDWDGRVVFGSVQTLARANRRARMASVSHLVIDECHRAAAASYQSIIEHVRGLNPAVKLLGLSATPGRGDGRSLRRTFTNVGYQLKIGTLIARGLLVPPRTFTIDLGVEDELAGLHSTAGDFDMRAADKVLNRSVLNEAVVEHWQAKAADRRSIFFCATVDHADAVAEAFRTAGVTAETISGDMPSRTRADLIARFDRGEVQVLTNCMVLTEGFDSQPVGCIGILRPMLHKGTFIQAIGRGLRRVDPERFPGIVKPTASCSTSPVRRFGTGRSNRRSASTRRIPSPARHRGNCARPVRRIAARRVGLRLLRSRLHARSVRGPPADRLRHDGDRPAGAVPIRLVRPAWRRPGDDGERVQWLGRGVP